MQSRSCINDYQVPSGGYVNAFVTIDNRPSDSGIFLWPAAARMIDRLRFQSEIAGRNRKTFAGEPAIRFLRAGCDHRFAGQRYFIETIVPMNDPGLFNANSRERRGDALKQGRMPDPKKLKRRIRRIRQRTDQVKYGADAKLTTHSRDARGRAVEKRRKHETDSVFV